LAVFATRSRGLAASGYAVGDFRLLSVPDYGPRWQRGVRAGRRQRFGDGRALAEHDLSKHRIGQSLTLARVFGIVDNVPHGTKFTWICERLNGRSGACSTRVPCLARQAVRST